MTRDAKNAVTWDDGQVMIATFKNHGNLREQLSRPTSKGAPKQ